MSDYIKREDAKQLFMNHLGNHFPQSFKEQIVEKAFEELPLSADVVEVVRCKDCKQWDEENHSCNIRDSYGWDYKPTDYCSYGEKKDGSDTVDND